MLHKIDPPDCHEQMDWIIQLQRRLLTALCQPTTTPQQVTFEWVVALLRDLRIDKRWIRRFCHDTDEISGLRKPMLEHMHVIAACDPALKTQLLAAFENDVCFTQQFTEQSAAGNRRLMGIALLDDQLEDIRNAVRGFFESFYTPNFLTGIGYRMRKQDGSREHFHRTAFINAYLQKNTRVKVCPACDGSLDNSDVDHFYPKSRFPFLACSLWNLVPLCQTCNRGRNGKRDKVPLTQDADDQTAEWFHPYLRPIHATYEFRPVRTAEGLHLILHSDDVQQQKRLDNYLWLFGMQERWREALINRVNNAIAMVQDLLQEKGKLSQDELIEELRRRTKTYWYDRGTRAFALIDCAYFESVSNKDANTFEYLWFACSVYPTAAEGT